MKNTIFRKLFITYGLTIILGFGILALLLLQILGRYFIESKEQLLVEEGKKIQEEIITSYYTGSLDREKLNQDLQVLDRFLNARIWLVDERGIIFGTSGAESQDFLGEMIPQDRLLRLYKGETITEEGTFSGLLSGQSITVGYPVFYNSNFRVGVLLHASLPEVQQTFRDVYRLTVWAIILSIFIAYLVLYFQIRKISRPLHEINEAAKVIAGGEFHKRLTIHSGDEIEELGDSFNHMAGSLEKIEDNRRNLIANISHDLRSPMTSIQGFVGGILDGTIPEEKREYYLGIVMDESRRLIKMINHLLELSNMQQGSVAPEKKIFELNETIRRQLISFEQEITAKKLLVTLSLCTDPLRVVADANFTARIIHNLLDNAVKFTPENEAITISTSDHGEKIQLAVMNTGVSIPPEELNQIWERFHKVDASRGEDRTGYGLGLAIVREMVQRQGEKIWAESGDDWLRFIFTIEKA